MKTEFTNEEKAIIATICSMYRILAVTNKDGVFKGLIPNKTHITLNGTYFIKLLNTTNAVYLDKGENMTFLTIVAQ